MIAFDVFLNRKKLARAGVGSDGVLTAITTWVRRTIKVITAERVDEPRRRVAEDPKSIERSQRLYYQHLKRKFEKPRTK